MTTVWIIEMQVGRQWFPLLAMGFCNYKRQAVKRMKAASMGGVALRVAKYIREERR